MPHPTFLAALLLMAAAPGGIASASISSESMVFDGSSHTSHEVLDLRMDDGRIYLTGDSSLFILDVDRQPLGIYTCADVYFGFKSLAVADGIAYLVSADALHTVDVSNPRQPVELGYVQGTGNGYDIELQGEVAFIAGGRSGVITIDISDPRSPQIIAVYETADNAFDLALAGDIAYLADSVGGVYSYDISDPAALQVLDICTDFSNVTAIDVRGALAVVGEYREGVWTMDISDPRSLRPLDFLELPSHGLQCLLLQDGIAHLGDDYGGLWAIDLPPGEAPRLRGELEPWRKVYNLRAGPGSHILAACDWGMKLLKPPAQVGDSYEEGRGLATAHKPRSIAADSTYLYAYDGLGNKGLLVLDRSRPQREMEVGFLSSSTPLLNLRLHDGALYATSSNQLRVFDIDTPSAPREIGRVTGSGSKFRDLVLQGDYAYAALEEYSFAVYDVSDPENPYEIWNDALSRDHGTALDVQGNYLYLLIRWHGLQIWDISDPHHPRPRGYRTLSPYSGEDIVVRGDYAFIATYHEIVVLDISNPWFPLEVSRFYCQYDIDHALLLDGDLLYGLGTDGIEVVSVADPLELVSVGYWLNKGSRGYPSDLALYDHHSYSAWSEKGVITTHFHPLLRGPKVLFDGE
jgi:hypothetical protein